MHNTQRNKIDKREIGGHLLSGTVSPVNSSSQRIFGYCTYRKLYNFTVFPSSDKNQEKYQSNQTVMTEILQERQGSSKNQFKKVKGHNRSSTEAIMPSNKQDNHLHKILDKLPQSSSLSKNQLIQKLKNQILEKHKSEMMSNEQV